MVNLDVWSVILGFGALNGFFLTTILWLNKKGVVRSNRLLAALLFCIAIFTFELVLYRMGLYQSTPEYSMFSFPFAYFIAPLFYLYTRSFIVSNSIFQKIDLVHLLIPFLALAALIPYYFWSPEDKLAYFKLFEQPADLTLRHLWLGGLFLVQSVAYLWITYRYLNSYQRDYKLSSSGTGVQRIEWLNKLMLTFMIFIFINAIISLFYLIIQFKQIDFFETIIIPAEEINMIILTFFAHLVGYNAINHPTKLFPANASEPKYARSRMTDEESQRYLNSLRKVMSNDKLFLNPDLTLHGLAHAIDLSNDQVSQVINKELSLNFYDFVNQYRVREAQERLVDQQYNNLSILGIALDSGFSSKSSFNRIFKKHLGITPSEYMSRQEA
ncbi:helix-turn-helix domain-containing protein [Ekhidna sp.]|uniref:AraC family transcriptional regulator n=1 Tax=Ekhidna sp. TaxID=2608089 RepID=UPI003299BBBA